MGGALPRPPLVASGMDWARLARTDPLVVLGIDPGSRTLGFGVVGRRGRSLIEVDHGAFKAPGSATAIEQRLLAIAEGVGRLIDHHRPDVIALEEAFVRENVQSALRLGEARGMVLLRAAERGCPVVQYPTAVAKKAVCGHGGASKELVAEMVTEHLQLSSVPKPHDAADGLALALCLLFDPRLDARFDAAT